jgi:hypothetical protein
MNDKANIPAAPPSEELPARAAKWFALAAAIISTAGVMLVLLGYGFSLVVESEFGMPHSALIDSTFEYVDLASLALGQLGVESTRLLFDWETYMTMYRLTWPVLVIAAVGITAMFGLVGWIGRWRSSNHLAVASKRMAMLTRKLPSGNKRIWLKLLGVTAATPLFMMLILVVMAMVFAVLSIAPVSGLIAAERYVKEWVLSPTSCVPRISLADRLQRLQQPRNRTKQYNAVLCVAVVKDEKTLGRGRVVIMTSKAVVLFTPDGTVRKIPIADAIVESVPTL